MSITIRLDRFKSSDETLAGWLMTHCESAVYAELQSRERFRYISISYPVDISTYLLRWGNDNVIVDPSNITWISP